MNPVNTELLIFAVFFLILFGIPIFAVAFRFALKPAVEAIIRLREAFAEQSGSPSEIAAMRAEIDELRKELNRVLEKQEFDSQLLTSAAARREEPTRRSDPQPGRKSSGEPGVD